MKRLALFGACGLLAIWLGYFAVGSVTGGHLIIHFGYYYILGVFALFLVYAHRVVRERREVVLRWVRRPGAAGLAIALGLVFAVWSDAFKHKILFDEFVIQGTACAMHETKEVSTILRAYNIDGTWVSIDTFLDKRPFFFPFLVSLVHDLTGYRLANTFAVNVACAGAFLGLLYWFVRQLAGRGPAILAVALMATLPLFGQNATGAGMDLHNLMMVLLVACLGVLYLRNPGEDRLSLLILGDVLLTESRYESVIFVPAVALLVILGWVRAGRILLPWPVIIAPLLLIPYALHSRVLASEPVFWQLEAGRKTAFEAANILGNLRGDVTFLFNRTPNLANSWYLTVVGLAGLAGLGWAGIRRFLARPRPALSAPAVVGLAMGAGVALHFGILLFYWWARFDDLMASRFSLPLYVSFAVLAAVLARDLGQRRLPALRVGFTGLAVWFLISGMPAFSRRLYTDQNLSMQEIDWEHRILDSRPGPVLFISNLSTIPFVLWHIETLLNDVGAQRGEQIRYHLSQGTFKEVLVAQAIRPTGPDGNMGIDPSDVMPPSYHLEKVAEKRFGGRLARISRIVRIDPQPEKAGAPELRPTQGPDRPVALRSMSPIQSRSDPWVASRMSAPDSRYTKIE